MKKKRLRPPGALGLGFTAQGVEATCTAKASCGPHCARPCRAEGTVNQADRQCPPATRPLQWAIGSRQKNTRIDSDDYPRNPNANNKYDILTSAKCFFALVTLLRVFVRSCRRCFPRRHFLRNDSLGKQTTNS